MPTRITPIEGIIPGIGIAVDVHAGDVRVPGVWRQEAAQQRVVVAGVEVLEARLGIKPLVDVALALQRYRAVGGQRRAEGAVVGPRDAGDLPRGS